jgi:uncharacterized protein (DUF488 family)
MTASPIQIFTVGHSNRSLEDFLILLKESEIQTLADIRRYPGSRKFPHFNQRVLRNFLEAEKIQYVWFEALGGRRHALKNEESPNLGIELPAFRNYADYMMTDQFRVAANDLLSLGKKSTTAVVCAEKLYWKCHRRLLSDFLCAQGVDVKHIFERGHLHPHKLTSIAAIGEAGTLTYPKPAPEQESILKL